MNLASVTVTGTTGKDYVISLNSRGFAQCTCPAFQYAYKGAKTCKHIAFAAAALAGSPAAPKLTLVS